MFFWARAPMKDALVWAGVELGHHFTTLHILKLVVSATDVSDWSSLSLSLTGDDHPA